MIPSSKYNNTPETRLFYRQTKKGTTVSFTLHPSPFAIPLSFVVAVRPEETKKHCSREWKTRRAGKRKLSDSLMEHEFELANEESSEGFASDQSRRLAPPRRSPNCSRPRLALESPDGSQGNWQFGFLLGGARRRLLQKS
jgi:hypothetical protein